MADRVIPLLVKALAGAAVLLLAIVLLLVYLTRRDPRPAAAKVDLAELQRTLEKYRADTGEYPVSLQDLFSKRYLDLDRRRDPWGNLYRYARPGRVHSTGVDVWSMGADGWDGSADDVYP
jgi:general secretion pathway protein G